MRIRGERGAALALAVFAIAIGGLLVAAVFMGALREQRAGEDTLVAEQAFEAAEGRLASVIDGWDASVNRLLAVGVSRNLPPAMIGRTRSSATITRLNGQLYLIRVVGARLGAADTVLARRVLGLVVRLAPEPTSVRPLAERGWAQLYE